MVNPPKTLKEAQNHWYGIHKNYFYSPGQCAYEVFVTTGRGRWHQCLHRSGHGPDGLYCKQHAKMVK